MKIPFRTLPAAGLLLASFAIQAITVGEVNALALTPAGGMPEDMAALARSSRTQGEELVRISKLKFE